MSGAQDRARVRAADRRAGSTVSLVGEPPASGGTAPRPLRSAPWHTPQKAIVRVLPPVVTSASPCRLLPGGT